MATTPSAHGPDYGFLWWLNTKQKQWPSGPPSSFAAIGNGGNIVWIDPQHDLYVMLLTNRVNPTREHSRIAPARVAVADAAMRALFPATVKAGPGVFAGHRGAPPSLLPLEGPPASGAID